MKKVFINSFTFFLLGAVFSLIGSIYYFYELGKTSKQGNENIHSSDLDLENFWSVYETIEDEYYGKDGVQKKDIVDGAISGMVDSLGDINSEYLDPELTDKFNASLQGDFEGIGAVVEKVPLGVKIERILKGSPAKQFGVKAGDIIVRANDVDLEPLDIFDAIEEIKGPAGTDVQLDILRTGKSEILEITVTRDKIHIPSIEQEYFEEENISYISLNRFGDTSSSEFSQALEEVYNSESQGLILDLRDNGGGFLQSAVEVASEFLKKGKIVVTTKYKNTFFNQKYYSLETETIFDQKIVILINQNSASASEIVAGALRDYNKAIILGEQSYGKGSVQKPFDMPDGSLLKLTVAHWYTPNGTSIEEEGIVPDITIEYQEKDYENEYDRQLEEAKKILSLYKEKSSIGLTVEAYNSQESEDISQEK